MAQKVIVTISDDIDGTEGAETLAFSLDGQAYEIDLGPTNTLAFREAMAPYTAAARRQGRTSTAAAGTARATRSSRSDLGAVRAWAQGQGMDVATRGRIPASVVASYDAFMSGKRGAVGAPTQAPPRVQQSVLPPITDADERYAQQHASAATTNAIRVINHARDNGGEFPPHNLNNHSDSVATLNRKGFVNQGEDGVDLVNGRALALLQQWEAAQAAKQRRKAAPSAHMSTQRTDLPLDQIDLPTDRKPQTWAKRSAAGLDRAEDATVKQIYAALSLKHLTMLRELAAGVDAAQVKFFSTSAQTLRNLGVVGFDNKITPRGVDALAARNDA